MTESYKFTSQLLVPKAELFKDHPDMGIHYFGDLKTDVNTVQVFGVNAETKEQIPAAIEKDRQTLLAATEKTTDEKQLNSLKQQLEFVNNLQTMLQNPVYTKQAEENLLDITSRKMNMYQTLKAEQVTYLSGISGFNYN